MKSDSNYLIKVLSIMDSEDAYSIEDVFTARNEKQAKYVAVSKYLENFANTGDHGSAFLNIVDRHYWKTETDNLIEDLFDFFQNSELDIFSGDHVTNTLCIKISEQKPPSKSPKKKVDQNNLLMSLLDVKGKIECEGF